MRSSEPSASASSRVQPLLLLSAFIGCAHAQPQPSIPGVNEQYSFHAPFEDINPFTGARQLQNWDMGGSAVSHRSFVRLTPEAQGSKGWMTSQQPFTLTEWSAMLELRASGASPHLYGDGLAIWLVKASEHIEGAVFGREDKWNGIGIFFDTFQNVDHSHHHKHPYIYVMQNDGTKAYIPDAEATADWKDSKQALPGADENSGCSYEFRYAETREDVSVLNHTRVHMTYRGGNLKLRLQQTSSGVAKEWFQCIDMKDVTLPSPGFWGVSSATGDLVDNHDIIQFVMRPLDGVSDPEADYDVWAKAEEAAVKHKMEEFDLRPPEALQRDYQRVLRAQAEAIKGLTSDVETLKQQLEFQLASMHTGIATTRKSLDDKSEALGAVTDHAAKAEELHKKVSAQESTLNNLKVAVAEGRGGSGWRLPFFLLFMMILALAGVGYNRYQKLYGKSHLP